MLCNILVRMLHACNVQSFFFLIHFVQENIKNLKVGCLSTFEEMSVQPKRPDLPKNKKVSTRFI